MCNRAPVLAYMGLEHTTFISNSQRSSSERG